jgi:hypothetical protein
MAYPLGWSMIQQMLMRRERWPGGNWVKAVPLVYPGQEVVPDQPVLRIERNEVFEAVQPVPLLSLPSSATGKIHQSDMGQGPISIPGSSSREETLPAGLHGRVVDITRRGGVIIESRAAVLQGTIGVGFQTAGLLTMWQAGTDGYGSSAIPPGAILIIPGQVNFALLRQALNSGVVGIIASSITSRDLEGFLSTDLVQLLDSDNVDKVQGHLPPITLLMTEGLGSFAMPAYIMNFLSQYQGSIALLSGTTSIRQGISPDLIVSLPLTEIQAGWEPTQVDPTPTLGAQVRVCGGDHEGAIGIIDYLFTYEQIFPGGIRARAVRLRLEDGALLAVPTTLVERIS